MQAFFGPLTLLFFTGKIILKNYFLKFLEIRIWKWEEMENGSRNGKWKNCER
jgi:hypothetical protein